MGFESKIFAADQGTGQEINKVTPEDVENKEPNKFLIISQWNNQESFQTFVASDAFRSVTNWGAKELLMGRPIHQIF